MSKPLFLSIIISVAIWGVYSLDHEVVYANHLDPAPCVETLSPPHACRDTTPGSINITGASGTPNENGARGSRQPFRLLNPLGDDTPNLTSFLWKLIDILLIFATPLIVIFIMYAGYLFVIAQGNSEKLEKARTALLWAIIGGVIILGAKIISDVIKGTLESF